MAETDESDFAPELGTGGTRMRGVVPASLIIILGLGMARGEEVAWRPAAAPPPTLKLGRPIPLEAPPPLTQRDRGAPLAPASFVTTTWPATLGQPQPIVRAQGAEAQPPAPPPPPTFGPGADEALNCGVVTGAKPGFFTRAWDGCKEWWQGVPGSVTGIFQPDARRGIFQSDHCYDDKALSPVTSPFLFEDPRALTEIRPIFIWQRTPSSNVNFAGGDNFFFGLQARLAITEWFSVVVNKVGWMWIDPQAPGGEFAPSNGFSELHLGPKVTFLHLDNLVAAAGVTFEVPTGPRPVFQDTGSLSLDPYLSFGFNLGDTAIGNFYLLNTTGYSVGTTNERSDFFYTSFHLSLDVMKLHKFFPLIELHWVQYTQDGTTRALGYEGRDMFNFGSSGIAGGSELTLAPGFRYKVSEALQFGLGAEFSILGGGRHLDAFRLTADMIIRY